MSVLIKGMELPTIGRILIVFPSGRVLEVSADATQDIFRETKAVPIPPHGRLIDADALLKKCDDGDDVMFIWAITDAPTIIEAEGESDE